MKKTKIVVPFAVAVLLGAWALVAFWPQSEVSPKVVVGTHKRVKVPKASKRPVRARRLPKQEKIGSDMVGQGKRSKPEFAIDDDDEASLTAEQRRLIQAIRDALDVEDRKEVLKLVQQLQTSDEWPDGIPKSIKMAAIEALGWFGASCIPELVGFLADRDPEVVQATTDKYGEMLDDLSLSDKDRSVILLQASKVVTDYDAMESMFFEIDNMRHSVAVETLKTLMEVDNEAVKKLLPETIESYTGEEGLDTSEKLDEWLAENPDDEDDEDFYAGETE